ncbi:MAG TPA: phenylalanine--tRNA ligase subunit beta [Pirellulales bacterium]|jgi:phenylalanyl-tRNA synthetase beta chain|nr:phenylalanine--tRNA ligase subunit beta [Pirellulales bacterium]
MLVSLNWLKTYVALDMPVEELTHRLMMAGFNHESSTPVGDDVAIDLEVTSNRPDCLGHIGVAREIAVLWQRALTLPKAAPQAKGKPLNTLASVVVDCPDLCPRYTARAITGMRVAPSPPWLLRRLATIGQPAINNVVDVTNYVMMESGQPLHAFDLERLAGGKIVVRRGRQGEKLEAIDHKTYELTTEMCVIADRDHAVGIAGIMGGASSEVTAATRNILLESALFDPSAIRAAARRLNLQSDSSYRFERGLDPEATDWTSRRACELILELAGGELASGAIDVGGSPPSPKPIVLRLPQLERILGIEVPATRVREILAALGNQLVSDGHGHHAVEVIPPSWRRDLEREIDLVEEVARIHGYDAIPEDVNVPMAPSARTAEDRVLEQLRNTLTALGYDEALTISVVDEAWSRTFSPWTDAEPLQLSMPILRRADRMRRSLVPSLLAARRTNETLGNLICELFEIARAYLPRAGELPQEDLMLALASGGDFLSVKGAIESLVARVNPALELTVEPARFDLFRAGRACALRVDGELLGYLGEVSDDGRKAFELRSATTAAEIRLAPLLDRAVLLPQYQSQSSMPAIERDLNLVVDERVRWSDLAQTVRSRAGALLERLVYRDTYRDPQRLGAGKKSLLLTVVLRQPDATLTGELADALRDAIVADCRAAFGAELRS